MPEMMLMLPTDPPILKGKDAKRFLAQDRQPLSAEKREHLRKCLELYRKNPVK